MTRMREHGIARQKFNGPVVVRKRRRNSQDGVPAALGSQAIHRAGRSQLLIQTAQVGENAFQNLRLEAAPRVK